MRQEFRELDLLDDITSLQFDEKLPTKIAMADRKNTLIHLFIEWKGEKYMPRTMHPAIQWSKSDPFLLSSDNVNWCVLGSKVDMIKPKPERSVPNVQVAPAPDVTKSERSVPAPDVKITESERSVPTDMPFTSGLKCKRDVILPITNKRKIIKKVKFNHDAIDLSEPVQLNIPLGTQW